ncbi:MAG: hypothetical protein ACLFST_02350 [Spirochaetia bacterium]
MDKITRNDLKELSEQEIKPAVSIYIPALKKGKEVDQNRIQLKNALSEAMDELEKNMRRSEAEEILKPAYSYLDNPGMPFHQDNGLAVFIGNGFFRIYQLPFTVANAVYVGERFHLRELLTYFVGTGRFYILAVSLAEPRFFIGSKYGIREVELEGMPEGIEETLQYDDPERQLHTHTRRPEQQGQRQAVFHGHESESNYLKEQSRRYFHELAGAVDDYLDDKNEPLVLFGLAREAAGCREAAKYPHLLEKSVEKNPDRLKGEEILAEAYKVVEPELTSVKESFISQYKDMTGSDKVTDSIDVIPAAAVNSRIDTLFVNPGADPVWGSLRPDQEVQELHEEKKAGDFDLIDKAVIETLRHGGNVFTVDREAFPEADPVAAILRY